MSKRHDFRDDQAGGPASNATREDLATAVTLLRESEQLRSRAAVLLAGVRARGDGEAAVGMPVEQHLRWNTNARRGLVSSLGVLTDVAAELPTLLAALSSGSVTLDQAFAVAWPAARVSRALRRSLDVSLATAGDGWTSESPEALQAEVERLLEDLAPERTEQQETERAQRQYLHLQPTLDGQGLDFHGHAWGLDAALLEQGLRAAADLPAEEAPDAEGVLVSPRSRRGSQLFEGLMRMVRGWASGPNGPSGDAAGVTIYAIVDETEESAGSGEVLTKTRGLSPRLSAAQVARLQAKGARRIEVLTIDREIVAVRGRAGHAISDPDGLSEETARIICTIRDRTCRMPGCDNPVEHLHHLVWRALARARGEVSPDDPMFRASVCTRCHHRVVHRWRWSATVGAVGRITWTRHEPGATTTTTSTAGRLAARLPRPPPPVHLDHDGQPLPF